MSIENSQEAIVALFQFDQEANRVEATPASEPQRPLRLMERPCFSDGTKRFSELHRSLEGVSHRTLTRQLRELADCGLIHRKVYAQVPPKVEYSLTSLGRTLKPVIDALHEWSEKHGRSIKLKGR